MKNIYTICLATKEEEIQETKKIISKMYEWREYEVSYSTPISLNDSHQRIIILKKNDVIVGTATIRVDSENGLLIDESYLEAANKFRSEGKRICEITKLAIDFETQSKNATMALYKMVCFYALSMGVTDYLIEINPRHSVFYRRLFGFKKILQSICDRIGGWPVELLHLEMKNVPFWKMTHSPAEIINGEMFIYQSNEPSLNAIIDKFNTSLNCNVTKNFVEDVTNVNNLHREDIGITD